MKSLNKKQLILVFGGIVVFVLLYFAPRKRAAEPSKSVETVQETDELSFLKNSFKSLDSVKIKQFEILMDKLEKDNDKIDKLLVVDSIISLTQLVRKPSIEAIFLEKKALLTDSINDFAKAADAYFFAVRFLPENERKFFYDKAIKLYTKLLETSPMNFEAKNNLAVCYVEGSTNPMQGIGLLREVLEVDSNNINAYLNLGYFAVKSGQYDKAVERFEKVLKIDPNYTQAYVYLGDVFETKKDFAKAITYYEKYKATLNDEATISEIDKYILSLKQKNI